MIVSTTIDNLNTLSSNPETGDNFRKLDVDLESTLAPCNIHHSSEATSNFLNNIQKPFLKAVIDNIKEQLPDTDILTSKVSRYIGRSKVRGERSRKTGRTLWY